MDAISNSGRRPRAHAGTSGGCLPSERRTARRSRRCRLWLLPLLWAPATVMALNLDVQVTGLEGALEQNVLALLGIYQERGDKDLTVPRMLALHRRAPGQIEEALAPFGRYRVDVRDQLIEPASDGGRWIARYDVDPGPPVKIGAVDYQVTGAGASNPRFPKQFPLRPGDVLLHDAYEKAKNEITGIASEEGYLDARLIRHQVLIDPVAYEANVEFHLDTGERWYLGKVSFSQDLLSDAYLQKFVNFEPGAVYDPALLLGLQGRLVGMEYYSDVEIVPHKERAGPDRVIPIEVVATREKPNKYRVGLGYATDVGPRLTLDYRRRYIGRNGHKAKAELELSEAIQSVLAEYRIPFRNPVRDYILIRPEFYGFDTASRQGTLFKVAVAQSVVTKRGWRRNIGIDYRYEDYEVADTDSDTFNGFVPYISWSKVRADDPINTRNGHRIKYIVKGTARGLSETNWLGATINYKVIRSFGDDFRFIARSDLGAILAADVADVPASERFFAGGDQSIRGWGLDVLGPNDPVTNDTIGGRYLAVGSLELERRIRGNWSGVVFTDFGNAFDPDYTAVWEQSAGLGVRYATPIGPVRVDVAYAITKDTPGFRLHFGLGPDL